MTRRIGGIVIIAPTAPQTCEICGAYEECRPYGPHGENICFACGRRNEPTTTRMMRQQLYGEQD